MEVCKETDDVKDDIKAPFPLIFAPAAYNSFTALDEDGPKPLEEAFCDIDYFEKEEIVQDDDCIYLKEEDEIHLGELEELKDVKDEVVSENAPVGKVNGREAVEESETTSNEEAMFPTEEDIRKIIASYPKENVKYVPLPRRATAPKVLLNVSDVLQDAPTSRKKFPCGFCAKSYVLKRDLDSHERAQHGDKRRPEYLCDHCLKAFRLKISLVNHIRAAHENNRTSEKENISKRKTVAASKKTKKANRNAKPKQTLKRPREPLEALRRKNSNNSTKEINFKDICKNTLYVSICKLEYTPGTNLTLRGKDVLDAEIKYSPLNRVSLQSNKKPQSYVITCKTDQLKLKTEVQLPNNVKNYSLFKYFPAAATSASVKTHPYRCELCGKRFQTKHYIPKHIDVVHKNERNFLCTYNCTYRANTKEGLKRHTSAVHLKEKRFKCSLCDKMFASKSNMTEHVLHRHRPNLVKKFQCGMCGKEFAFRGGLKCHVQCVHYPTRKFLCDLCKKSFKFKSHLVEHMNVAHRRLRRACGECAKTFTTTSSLNVHRNAVHRNVRNCVCVVCGARFLNNASLKCHVSCVHSDAREHACGECDKAFKVNSHLLQHVRFVHKRIRPHVCPVCGKTFSQKASMKIHVKFVHMKPKNIECPICFKIFCFERRLRTHLRTMHG